MPKNLGTEHFDAEHTMSDISNLSNERLYAITSSKSVTLRMLHSTGPWISDFKL